MWLVYCDMHRFKQIFRAFSKNEKVVFIVFTIFAAASGATLIITGAAFATKAVPATGGEHIEGVVGQPVYINPVLAASETDKGLVRLVFDNIYDLAEKIETSEDGRVWKIRLKENIFWHDGERFTSDDVIFTIQSMQNPDSNSPLLPTWQGIVAQRSSSIEFQLTSVNPYAFFANVIEGLYILPKHIFENIPLANWRLSDFNLRPVGSGPYKFTSFEKQPNGFISSYKINSWQNYHGEKALIRNLGFRFFKENAELIENFNAGRIGAIAGIEPQSMQSIDRPHEISVFEPPGYFAVFINQSKNLPLKEKAVREALFYSIDKKLLIEEALDGYGRPAFGPIPTDTKYFNQNLKQATTSQNLASSTLEKAGWKLSDGGWREKKIKTTTVPLELTLSVPQADFLVKTAEFLKKNWEGIGVKVNILSLPSQELEAAIKNRDYEAILFGNVLSRGLDLSSFWHSSERFHPGLNLSLYNSKEADGLIENIRQNLDEEKRMEQLLELQDVINGDLPAIFLYSPDYIYIANKTIRGVDGGFINEPADRFVSAPKWYIKTARVLK